MDTSRPINGTTFLFKFAFPQPAQDERGALGLSQTPPLKHIGLQEGSGKVETMPCGQEQTRRMGMKEMVFLVNRASFPKPRLQESLTLYPRGGPPLNVETGSSAPGAWPARGGSGRKGTGVRAPRSDLRLLLRPGATLVSCPGDGRGGGAKGRSRPGHLEWGGGLRLH